jgi:hypothetical protein
MGLLKVGLQTAWNRGAVGSTVKTMRHRAVRKAKISFGKKLAVSASSAVAAETTEMAIEKAGEKVQSMDSTSTGESTWSLTGMFIPDGTFEFIGRMMLELQPVALGARIARAGMNVSGRATERVVGAFSKKTARRMQFNRMRENKRLAKVQRLWMSKKQHKRAAKLLGTAADIGVAVGETVLTGGQGLAANVGARVGTRVAVKGLQIAARRSAKQTARRVARRAMRSAAT